MKKLIPFLLLILSLPAFGQRTMDTIIFKRGGLLYRMILYGDDSIKINSTMFRFGAASQWTTSGSNIYYNIGKVGVGTVSPDSGFAVTGGVSVTGGMFIGKDGQVNGVRFGSGVNSKQTRFGKNAIPSSTGFGNIAIGSSALYGDVSSYRNISIGDSSMFRNQWASWQGNQNVSIGTKSMYNNSNGSDIVSIGSFALFSNTSGNNNVAIGSKSLYSNTYAGGNTAIGFESLYSNIGGSLNTSIGYYSLRTSTGGSSNVAIGCATMYYGGTKDYNTAVGASAMYTGGNKGASNSAFGWCALFNTTGYSNTAIGVSALYSNTSGYRNIALGDSAGYSYTTLSRRMYLGVRDTASSRGVYFSLANGWGKWLGTMAITVVPDDAAPDSVLTYSGSVVKKAPFPNSIPTSSRTISSPTDSGTPGEMCWDDSYIYICVAANTWRRVAISSW